jgi:hypothetical protein
MADQSLPDEAEDGITGDGECPRLSKTKIRSIRTIHQACPVTPPESTNINPREQYRRQCRRVGGGFQTVENGGAKVVHGSGGIWHAAGGVKLCHL